MPKKRDDLAHQDAEKEAQVLAREGLETRLMEENASEVGEEVPDADAINVRDTNRRSGSKARHRSRNPHR